MAFPISNSTSGRVGDSFIPSITSGELLRSDGLFLNKIAKQVNEKDFLTFIEGTGSWMVTDDTFARWHQEGYIMPTATVSSLTGGATPGASFTITLPAGVHQTSGTRSPFGANDVLKIDNFYFLVQSKNTSVASAHVLTCIPTSTMTVAANTVVAANKTIIKVGKHFAEGTGYVDSDIDLPIKYEERTGIIKTKISLTGTAATNYAKVQNPDTNSVYRLLEADYKCFLEHKLEVNFAALIGPGGTATDAAGNTVNLVKGAVTQTLERGTDYTYGSSFTKNDLENFTRVLMKQRAGNEHMMQIGHEAALMMEQFVDDSMKQGARLYLDNANAIAKGGRMIDFGFDGFKVGDFMFYRQAFSAFNHPNVTYAAGQPYPFYVWTTPAVNVKDPLTGESGFSVKFVYKKAPGAKGISLDRKFEGKIGGDGLDSELDERNYRYLTEFGVAVVLANQSIVAHQ
jgi:hypothetical protein